VPYIYTVWDLQHRLQPYFPEVTVTGCPFENREDMFSSVCPKASFIITSNPAALDEVHLFYGIPKERIKLLPQPTSDFVFAPISEAPDLDLIPKEPYLYYPAQFWPHKNHVVILESLKLLEKEHGIRLRAVFTGADKGNKSYIEDYAKNIGVADRLTFLKFVSTATLLELYKNAEALVFPTFFGPENMPPMEAFALGCPVIASNVAGSEYQLKDAAILFDPRSERALTEGILKLRAEPQLRANLVAAGLERARNWTGDHYVDGVMAIVDEFVPIRRCWASNTRYIHT
jgi:glycosyltransferase involved in cell wall biosynthesis